MLIFNLKVNSIFFICLRHHFILLEALQFEVFTGIGQANSIQFVIENETFQWDYFVLSKILLFLTVKRGNTLE